MTWRASLTLEYRHEDGRTVGWMRHEGPLRVLKALHPEGPAVCHQVIVHPPGGVVGGDLLDIALDAGPDCHVLVTTPGATKFYRSDGPQAVQQASLRLAAGARLEWLPMEAIAYPGCHVHNRVSMTLAPGAQCLGWDVLALGLPAGDQAFDRGRFTQTLHWPGVWLEQGTVDGTDRRLLDSPLGWDGRRVLATAWFAHGGGWDGALREALLDSARDAVGGHAGLDAGATSPHAGLVLLRVLSPRVEPAMRALQAVRAAWRRIAWALEPHPPRIWQT